MGNIIGIDLLSASAAVMQDGVVRMIPGAPPIPGMGRVEILRKLKKEAEHFLKGPVTEAVLVMPMTQLWCQRSLLEEEGRKAGLKIRRILSAPTAAALNYCVFEEKLRKILICVLQDGTFEAAVIDVDTGLVEVMAADGGGSLKDALTVIRRVLEGAGMKPEELESISLLGNNSADPRFADLVREAFGRPVRLRRISAECIPAGAAVQCAILNGEKEKILLLDAIPMDLAVEAKDGTVRTLIERNTSIPARHHQTFATVADNQTEMVAPLVLVSPDGRKHSLKTLQFTGIPPAPKGRQVEMSFLIDASGNILTEAWDSVTKQKLSLKETAKPETPEKKIPCTDERQQIILALLPVYDDLERAVDQPTSDAAYKKGVEMTMKKLTDTLKQLGAEPYGRTGETFDPKLHEAAAHIHDGNLGENVICQVYRKGFRLNGRIIRYAMVQVAN